MNEELTDELLEAMKKCDGACFKCSAKEYCAKAHITSSRQELATALLEERAKPKVWDGAPDGSAIADVYWSEKTGIALGYKRFTRGLPKTRARQIAENIVRGINDEIHSDTKDIEYVEGVLKRYAEELEGKE